MKASIGIIAEATQVSRLQKGPCRDVVFKRIGRVGVRRRGMALMLVVILVALASVMGYSLLASTSMQTQVTSTTLQAASADAIAESGVNLAMYYLQNPTLAPLAAGDTFWKGGSNISLGSSVAGTCDVTVAQINPMTYQIQSVGRSSISADGRTLSRTINAKVKLTYTPSVGYASGANSSMTIPTSMTVTGNVQVNGRVTVKGEVNGDVIADRMPTVSGTWGGKWTGSASSASVPTSVPDFKPSYAYLGKTYFAEPLPMPNLSHTTLGPTATNPAGVYYWPSGDVALADNVTINGTLILNGGEEMQVNGSNNVISPILGFPGLMIKGVGNINLNSANSGLTINGMVYLGSGIVGSGDDQSASKLAINGAILMYGTSPTIDPAYNGTINVNYDSSKIVVPGIGSGSLTPTGVAVLSWD